MKDNYYEFFSTTEIIGGIDALNELPPLLKSMEATRVMLISGPVLNKIGIVDKVKNVCDSNGVEVTAIFLEVPNDGDIEALKYIADVYTVNSCDAILAVGGGSVIDMAKGAKLMVSQDTTDSNMLMGINVTTHGKRTPLVVLPTTSGTGCEVTSVAVVSDKKRRLKIEFMNKDLLPDACILDPSLVATLPPKASLTTAFDTLAHAIESFMSTQRNPISSAMTKLALINFKSSLRTVILEPDNLPSRYDMMLISTLAGMAFGNSMVGLGHAIAHSVGAVSEISHDCAVALVLAETMRFNSDVSKNLLSELLLYFSGEDIYLATKVENRVARLIDDISTFYIEQATLVGAPRNLKEAGVNREDFDVIANKTLRDGASILNDKPFTKQDVLAILEACYA